jgi:hypothetical protein
MWSAPSAKKMWFLFFPLFLRKKGIARDDKQCLLLVISGKLIVSAYWCKDPNYIFNKKDKPHFQILY